MPDNVVPVDAEDVKKEATATHPYMGEDNKTNLLVTPTKWPSSHPMHGPCHVDLATETATALTIRSAGEESVEPSPMPSRGPSLRTLDRRLRGG